MLPLGNPCTEVWEGGRTRGGAGSLHVASGDAGPSSRFPWRFFSLSSLEKSELYAFLNSKNRLSCQSYSQTFCIPSCPENFTWTHVWTVDSFWGRNRNENEAGILSYHRKRVGQTTSPEHQEPKQRFHSECRTPVPGTCTCIPMPHHPRWVRQGLRARVYFSFSWDKAP